MTNTSENVYEAGVDEEQVKFMEEDMCIVVSNDDEPIRPGSKKECHLKENIDKGLLHRAFSCFLFNKEGKLLLQQRSLKKITFPEMWTNTVCSHPLANERDESNGVDGVKVAAQRKLFHELGIPAEEVPISKMNYLTRIHYKAYNVPEDQWAEHEIDYIIFLQVESVTVTPNPGEAMDYRFVTIDEVKEIVQQAGNGSLKITPWFHLIFKKFLIPWWQTMLEDPSKLVQDDTIHRL
eukprot:TRINITY_DN19193_c0_g1_i1.p1 TRINITY_DN19193_c0_g1~~TRINITY_DN19193_c0_g1_i1.p1  ORF type:complete len:236 (-),score=57.78 TRINITY_DN19193_c0_g1_i1:43-750(-)